MSYTYVTANLTPNQIKKIKSSSTARCGTSITLKRSQMDTGSHKLPLTPRQHKKWEESVQRGKGIRVDLATKAISEMAKHGGDLIKDFGLGDLTDHDKKIKYIGEVLLGRPLSDLQARRHITKVKTHPYYSKAGTDEMFTHVVSATDAERQALGERFREIYKVGGIFPLLAAAIPALIGLGKAAALSAAGAAGGLAVKKIMGKGVVKGGMFGIILKALSDPRIRELLQKSIRGKKKGEGLRLPGTYQGKGVKPPGIY